MMQEYLEQLKPVAVELVFSKDTANIFRNNQTIKKQGLRCGSIHYELTSVAVAMMTLLSWNINLKRPGVG